MYYNHTCSTSCPDNPVSSLILCFRRLLAVDSKSFFFSNRAFGKLSGNWPLLKKRFCKSKFPFLNLCNRVSQSKTYLRKCLQTLVTSLPTRLAFGSNTTVTSIVHEFTVSSGSQGTWKPWKVCPVWRVWRVYRRRNVMKRKNKTNSNGSRDSFVMKLMYPFLEITDTTIFKLALQWPQIIQK